MPTDIDPFRASIEALDARQAAEPADYTPPESYDQLVRDFPASETLHADTPTDEQLERQREALAPLPITLLNRTINRLLDNQRRRLPLSVGLVVELLDARGNNRRNRERRERLQSLRDRRNVRSYSVERLDRALADTPESYEIDADAVARAMADSSLTFTRDGDCVAVAWETDEIALAEEDGSNAQTFGRFRCKVALGSHIVKAVALTPNPAAESEHTTHPHVRAGAMCLGEAQLAIVRAGKKGRASILRRTVETILSTYNPGSPYIPLSRWEATPCGSCGRFSTGDETNCVQCNRRGCRSCLYWANRYDCSVCRDCSLECSGCGERFPSRERVRCNCPRCSRPHCSRCLPPTIAADATPVSTETLDNSRVRTGESLTAYRNRNGATGSENLSEYLSRTRQQYEAQTNPTDNDDIIVEDDDDEQEYWEEDSELENDEY